ncbi:MAG: hypothetical protein WAL89_04140 [Candidatus Sulfotelmatobacter sp.]|jgi:hypothetical protein
MKTLLSIPSVIVAVALSASLASAQPKTSLGQNAALRYWSAFAQMQDAPISNQQIKDLSAILAGTSPYDDSKYRDLIEKNHRALETMARGTMISGCDWGLDYALGPDTPIDYAPKATALARLNVLYVFHLLASGNKEGAVRALVAGLRFSRDIANGGSLMATLLAKDSLAKHLGAMAVMSRLEGTGIPQRALLQNALAQLGPDPLNWQSSIKLEMDIIAGLPLASWPSEQVTQAYVAALKDPSTLPSLQQVMASLPQPVAAVIPNPKRVLEERWDLIDKLQKTRSILQ